MLKPALSLAGKFAAIAPALTERSLRLWAAGEARSLGHGGIKAVAQVTGLSRRTIDRGLRELEIPASAAGPPLPPSASRRPGGGRKKLTALSPALLPALLALVDPVTRGHPESPLLWSAKSTAKLAAELCATGHQVSERSVATLLKENGYSLQAMRKTKEGGNPENRDAWFQHIAAMAAEFQAAGQPVVSVDAKKKRSSKPLPIRDGSGSRRAGPKRPASMILSTKSRGK